MDAVNACIRPCTSLYVWAMDAVNSQRIAEHVRHALYGWAMDSIHGSSCCVRPYIGLMDAVIILE